MSPKPASCGNAKLSEAMAAPRIVIDAVSPRVDEGRFPAKGVSGQPVVVEATIFMDGHDQLAARLRWGVDGELMQTVAMLPLGNDRWRAWFVPTQPGVYRFTIEAWLDRWGSYCDELDKKFRAGVAIGLEITEGRQLMQAAMAQCSDSARACITAIEQKLDGLDDAAVATILLFDKLRTAMAEDEARPFFTGLPKPLPLDVECCVAGYASWYELFPRSQTHDAGRHGTLDDVIARLPALVAMGFDVLYLPPIHPIGLTHRKGPNNAVTASAADPGSPYAIGAQAGGHCSVHPDLGGIDAFRRLRVACQTQGLELAMDFALQCSPDHPWIGEHPEWFFHRPDGSIRYAENPPKKYEDIVNLNFYAEGAQTSLWLALHDVLLYWIGEGVKIFRVDNPHTKPLPFWQWLIADIRKRHPDALFLAEAFTTPAMMYRLAQIGFSQSYTYFTWRNTRKELEDYLTELTAPPAADFYRPHFFVNTPDINPYFLQTSGRAGFLIRAALAATLSGLWGIYSGFELCESAPLPGREEYLDSEKYQLRPRNWTAPGNIIHEIALLNRIRRENPALQTHLGLRFLAAWNPQVLLYTKSTPDRSNFIMVGVSLDPHQSQETRFEIPLDAFGLTEGDVIEVEDLLRGNLLIWRGKVQHWVFHPHELPFAILRLRLSRIKP